ncbi:MAG: FAD-dependent oxidoreductase [Pseudomonadota bacterium]
MSPPDVTVLGAGAVGIASALSLVEAGLTVEVIDRDPPAAGASHGNAGVVSPWSCVPQALPGLWRSVPRWLLDREGPLALRVAHAWRFVPWALKFLAAGRADRLPAIADAMHALSRPSVELYRQNLAGTGAEHLLRDACYLHVYREGRPDLTGPAWRLREERGVPFRIVEGPELAEIEPALAPGSVAVLIEGQGRAMDPGAIGRAIAEKAAAKGADFHRMTVEAIRPGTEGGWQLTTDQGPRDARHLVLAAGAWSARLLAPLGVRLPLEAERGYHAVLKDPGIEVRHSIMDVSGKFVASGMAAGIRCAGTAEFGGLDAKPDMRRAEMLRGQALRLFPGLRDGEVETWSGVRPSFPDSLPCIGALKGFRDITLAFGHSHYGFGMAPATGRIVAGLVSGRPPNTDLAPYAAERFA